MPFKPSDFLDLSQTEHAALFEGCAQAWDALRNLQAYVAGQVRPALHNRCDGVAFIGKQVFIGEGTVVEDGAMIQGPAIIGRNCHIRHNAYIRDSVLIGDGCVVGNACELRHSILFNGVQMPHLNYVGDSILGYKAHIGAGVILSNFRLIPGNVRVTDPAAPDGRGWDTGLLKFGALLGDAAEVGCNSVLNPGSVLGRNSVLYPNMNWRGVLPAGCLAKAKVEVEIVTLRRETKG